MAWVRRRTSTSMSDAGGRVRRSLRVRLGTSRPKPYSGAVTESLRKVFAASGITQTANRTSMNHDITP